MAPKRAKPDHKEGPEFIKIGKKGIPLEKLTIPEVQTLFCRAFGLSSFPGWETPKAGHMHVRIQLVGSNERICLSFWPSTSKILFQGTKEESEKCWNLWNACLKDKSN